jgi:hypothetical protein
MTFAVRLHNLEHASVFIHPEETKERQQAALSLLRSIAGTAAFLRSTSTSKVSTAQEAFLGAVHLCPQAWEGVLANAQPRLIRLHCIYDNDADHFVMDTSAGPVRVQSIVYEGQLSLQETDVPPEASRYVSLETNEGIAEIAKFSGKAGSEKLSVELRRIPDSRIHARFLRRDT